MRRARGQGPGVRTDDGVLLHVEAEGSPDADLTVVLVHGFATRAGEFRAQRRALAPHVRVVAFDQRGHGSSGWNGHGGATLTRLGQDLAEVIEHRTSGQVVLVGHSMGGMAVMALASQRPDLVRSTVAGVALISTSVGHLARTALPSTLAKVVVRAGLARALFFLDWLAAPLFQTVRPFRRSWGQQWLRKRLFGTESCAPDVLAEMEDMWESTPRSVTASFYPELVEHHRRQALEMFSDTPSLVLTGAQDATIPARHSRRIADVLGPMARLVEVPGAGHMVNMTRPDAVNAELLELLDRVREHARDGRPRDRQHEQGHRAAEEPADSSPGSARRG